jgi:hypothetical protein
MSQQCPVGREILLQQNYKRRVRQSVEEIRPGKASEEGVHVESERNEGEV